MNKYKLDNKLQNNLMKTPCLIVDLKKIKEAYNNFHKNFKDVEVHYAMKCNPNPEIMKMVLDCGGQFEISSADEMRRAVIVGADPKNIIFSNPVKTTADICCTYKAGVSCFSFDSYCEVDKLAQNAPGSKVYVRLSTPVQKSTVASEGKFGVSIDFAKDLMIYAKKCGLIPYGIAFHVGSQMLDCDAWSYAIQYSSKLINILEDEGIAIKFLDIGGGFPVCYGDVKRDNIDKIGKSISRALKKYIKRDVKIVAEPGRYLVASSGTMVGTVIGIADRYNKRWAHLDIGALNGFLEALETSNNLIFPVRDSRQSKDKNMFVLTGPTCDSQDTIRYDVPMSHDIQVGDNVYFDFAGAYTTSYTENFNGFPSPKIYIDGIARKVS
jgi:ornithine decarboxylase